MNEELNRVRLRSAPPPAPPSSSHIVQRLEGERDDARLEVQQLRTECQSLRERMNMMRQGGGRGEREEVFDEQFVSQLQEKVKEVSTYTCTCVSVVGQVLICEISFFYSFILY